MCLADRAVKALALEARPDRTLGASMAERDDRFARRRRRASRRWAGRTPRPSSQLFAAMTAEIAVRELDAGRRLPAARRACAASSAFRRRREPAGAAQL